jgi:imidazole glycerol-phosphate synthase subunit HisF
MLRARIIPCLLVKEKGLVKTVKFESPKYIGDPINAVRIFNEKEVDELVVLDIDASACNKEPDYDMIGNLAEECRMPLCYGGGVKNVDQIGRIIQLGVEKVSISSAAIKSYSFVEEAVKRFGSQSVVVVLDIKKDQLSGQYQVFLNNGRMPTKESPFNLAPKFADLGVGEIVINSIDQDGVMTGYDLHLVDQILNQIKISLTVLGGAGSLSDIKRLIDAYKIIGAAAGSLFVFKGKYKAVLINYPDKTEKHELFKDVLCREASVIE